MRLARLKPKTPGSAGRLVSRDEQKNLCRLNLKASLLDSLHDLGSRELVGFDRENLIRVGRINLPVAGSGLLVEGGRNGFDAAAAVDIGFELEGFHDELS